MTTGRIQLNIQGHSLARDEGWRGFPAPAAERESKEGSKNILPLCKPAGTYTHSFLQRRISLSADL